MVKDVERLRPELQLHALVQGKLPTQGEVVLPSTQAAHLIPAKVPGLAGCGSLESRAVDLPASWRSGVVYIERNSWNYVRPDVDQRAVCRIELRSSNQVDWQR